MTITVVNELPADIWRQFVATHPAGNIFHTPEMFRVFEQTKQHRPVLWAAVDQNGSPAALLLPVEITLFAGLLRSFTTRAIAYGSVLCLPGQQGADALNTLLRAYTSGVSLPIFTELRNLSDLQNIQPVLNENNFVYEEHLNFLIDIGLPVDTVWRNIRRSARKNIGKALRKDVLQIEEARTPAQIAACYAIFQETYSNAQVPLVDSSLFESAFKVLYPEGMIKFLLGRIDNEYVAASAALLYKDVIYGWYRGFKRAYSSYIPNDLMVWHILKWGAENGYQLFDFGGAGKPNQEYGPRKFKAKFGGRLVNYGRNTLVHAPTTLRLSQTAYQVIRKFL